MKGKAVESAPVEMNFDVAMASGSSVDFFANAAGEAPAPDEQVKYEALG